jgi:hypothetical protein
LRAKPEYLIPPAQDPDETTGACARTQAITEKRIFQGTEGNYEGKKIMCDLVPEMAKVFETFEFIQVAEEEVRRFLKRQPESAAQLRTMPLVLLRPSSECMKKARVELYRHHCAELLERIRTGADTTLGTSAEVMLLLSRVSLVRPLGVQEASLYARLFSDAFPCVDIGECVAEPWPGACSELLKAIQHQLRIESRRRNVAK